MMRSLLRSMPQAVLTSPARPARATFPSRPAHFARTKNGAFDAFVTKLNAAGSALVYSTFIGGSEVDFGVRIKVDASNNAFVLGNTRSPNFPTTPGAFDTSPTARSIFSS